MKVPDIWFEYVTGPEFMGPTFKKAKTQKKKFIDQDCANQEDGSPSDPSNPS